jgi:hypothetical protein
MLPVSITGCNSVTSKQPPVLICFWFLPFQESPTELEKRKNITFLFVFLRNMCPILPLHHVYVSKLKTGGGFHGYKRRIVYRRQTHVNLIPQAVRHFRSSCNPCSNTIWEFYSVVSPLFPFWRYLHIFCTFFHFND